MRRSLVTALLGTLLTATGATAQVLDETLVPRGHLRFQLHPTFTTWDSRYGRTDDGTELTESLGDDLTDPTGLALFPGTATLVQLIEGMTGVPDYAPTLGDVQGRVTQDITRVDFGGHLGVTDWLTIGVVVPWVETRTAIDIGFLPDTVGGADLGLSPALTSPASVNAYLTGLGTAAATSGANAMAVCASGPSASCTAAQSLASRASTLHGAATSAYSASAFFPAAGSSMAASLAQVSSALDADLIAAGLSGIGAQMAFATTGVTEADFGLLPATLGAGIEGTPLGTRRGLYQAGDVEVSALVRLLEHHPVEGGRGPSYLLTAGFLMRLPTGAPEDPDIFLDVGTGDGQTDLEARLSAAVGIGPFGLAVGGRYGLQRGTTLTRRVAPLEVALPALSTRQTVQWQPASYLSVDVAPSLRLTDELSFAGVYRYFHKRRDAYTLLDPSLPLDATVLARETGVKVHQVGAGLRFATVRQWVNGDAPRPIELHLRVVFTAAGSGGQTPVSTRVEAGIRLFRGVWGALPSG